MDAVYPFDDEINIYSIHAWKYGERRNQLHDLLGRIWIKGIDYHDLSVPEDHPIHSKVQHVVEAALTCLISRSDVILVLAGMYLNFRRWMKFEIETAYALGKPILLVAYNGQKNLPEFARRYTTGEPLHWRSSTICDGILSQMPLYRQRAFSARRMYASRDKPTTPLHAWLGERSALASTLAGLPADPPRPEYARLGERSALASRMAELPADPPRGEYARLDESKPLGAPRRLGTRLDRT